MNSTHPLPTDGSAPPPIDHAALIAQAQAQLEATAAQIKGVALDLVDQKLSAGLLRAYDGTRRWAVIVGTFVQDLQNEQTRQALEAGAPLPPDLSPAPLFGSTAATDAPSSPSSSQVGNIAVQPTQVVRTGGFLQEP